jgi:hypothetical protein
MRLVRFMTPVMVMNALATTQADILKATIARWKSRIQISDNPIGDRSTSDMIRSVGITKIEPGQSPPNEPVSFDDRNQPNPSSPVREGSNSSNSKVSTPGLPRVSGTANVPQIPNAAEPKVFPTFMRNFQRNMSQARRRFRPDPQRGAVVISGLVEVVGTKSVAILDVMAEYDVLKDRFLSLEMFVRSLRPRKQSPRGDNRPKR